MSFLRVGERTGLETPRERRICMFWTLIPISRVSWPQFFALVFVVVNMAALLWSRYRKAISIAPEKPVPPKYGKVMPGDELGKLELFHRRRLHPAEVNGQHCKEIHLHFGPFKYIRFFFSEKDEKISRIVFVFRSQRASLKFKKAALDAFGSPDTNVAPLEILTWKNIQGFKVVITPTTYEIDRCACRPKRRA